MSKLEKTGPEMKRKDAELVSLCSVEHMVFAVAYTMPCCQGLSHSYPLVPSRGKGSAWHIVDEGNL